MKFIRQQSRRSGATSELGGGGGGGPAAAHEVGPGLVSASVVASGEPISLQQAEADPRFNSAFGAAALPRGVKVHNLLACPPRPQRGLGAADWRHRAGQPHDRRARLRRLRAGRPARRVRGPRAAAAAAREPLRRVWRASERPIPRTTATGASKAAASRRRALHGKGYICRERLGGDGVGRRGRRDRSGERQQELSDNQRRRE